MADDEFDNNDETQGDEERVAIPKRDLQNLREKARRAEHAERELAFAKAGLPLEDKRMGYFVKGYDGEMTAEAIKAAALEAGFLQVEQPPPPASAASPYEQQAHQMFADAQRGGIPPQSSLTPDDFARASSAEDVIRMAAEMGMLSTRE